MKTIKLRKAIFDASEYVGYPENDNRQDICSFWDEMKKICFDKDYDISKCPGEIFSTVLLAKELIEIDNEA